MQEEEELGWIGGLVRPLCSTVLRVGGWGLANDSHPCSLSMSQGHMSAPDNQPAIQEAEWTMKNPFIFLECKRELDFKMAHTSPFCCGSVCGVFFLEWQRKNGGWAVEERVYYVLFLSGLALWCFLVSCQDGDYMQRETEVHARRAECAGHHVIVTFLCTHM